MTGATVKTVFSESEIWLAGKKKITPLVFSAKTFWAPCSVGTSKGLISPLQATTSLQSTQVLQSRQK